MYKIILQDNLLPPVPLVSIIRFEKKQPGNFE